MWKVEVRRTGWLQLETNSAFMKHMLWGNALFDTFDENFNFLLLQDVYQKFPLS